MRLRFDDGDEVEARIKGKRLRPVCGDRVHTEPLAAETDWLITDILERRNALTRPNLKGEVEVLAANIDLLVVMAAASPPADWFIVDRYLSAAEFMGVDALVAYNKTDVDGTTAVDTALAEYRDIGYGALRMSAKTGDGVDAVAEAIGNRTTIVVGQSGVGKSTLINRLVGEERQRTGETSSKSGEGRHTTVNSVWLQLPGGGAVIDSPGVRDYAPAIAEVAEVDQGFREIRALAQDCRFSNCRHMREPGCAVKDAADQGRISARRYESYRRLYILTDQLSAGRY